MICPPGPSFLPGSQLSGFQRVFSSASAPFAVDLGWQQLQQQRKVFLGVGKYDFSHFNRKYDFSHFNRKYDFSHSNRKYDFSHFNRKYDFSHFNWKYDFSHFNRKDRGSNVAMRCVSLLFQATYFVGFRVLFHLP